MNGKTKTPLAALPSVDRMLNADAAAALIAEFGRAETTDALRDADGADSSRLRHD